MAASRKRHLTMLAIAAAVAGAGFLGGIAVAAQPRMQAALGALQNARAELAAASADKGGHRLTAMRLIDQAIGEVRAGIAAGMM